MDGLMDGWMEGRKRCESSRAFLLLVDYYFFTSAD